MPGAFGQSLDDAHLDLLVALLLVDLLGAVGAFDRDHRVCFSMQDADRDLILGQLVVVDAQHVAGVGDDSIDQFGVGAGEPVAEERPLAVAVDVDLVDGELALEVTDEPGDVITIGFALGEVEGVTAAGCHPFRCDDDIVATKSAATDGVVPERPAPGQAGAVEHQHQVWRLLWIDLVRQSVPVRLPLSGCPFQRLALRRIRRWCHLVDLAVLLR